MEKMAVNKSVYAFLAAAAAITATIYGVKKIVDDIHSKLAQTTHLLACTEAIMADLNASYCKINPYLNNAAKSGEADEPVNENILFNKIIEGYYKDNDNNDDNNDDDNDDDYDNDYDRDYDPSEFESDDFNMFIRRARPMRSWFKM